MRWIIPILLLVPFMSFGQAVDAGTPAEQQNVPNIIERTPLDSINVTKGTIDQLTSDDITTDTITATVLYNQHPHAFLTYSDSALLIDATQNNWIQITNATDSLFRVIDNEDIGVSGDTIVIQMKGSYKISTDIYAQGTAVASTWQFAFFANGTMIGSTAERTTRTTDTGAIGINVYYEAEVGDEIWLSLKNTSNDTDVTMKGGNIVIHAIYISK